MSIRKYVNNSPTTTVSGAINSAVTSFTVASLAGFPASFPYTSTLGLGTTAAELVSVTGAAGAVVTVIRNFDGQGAFSHPDGETFNHVAAAIDYTEANAHVNATSGVHGATGSVVGTTDTQTLSAKTLTSPVVNDPTINKAGQLLTLPAGPATLVSKTSTDTLTNKTLTSPAINGGVLDGTSTIAGQTATAIAALVASVAALPKGRVASATRITNVTVTTTEAMVTGLDDISVTAVAGRRYKLTFSAPGAHTGTSANSETEWSVRDGGASAPTTASTAIAFAAAYTGTTLANRTGGTTLVVELVGLSAGTHRLGLSVFATGGTNTQEADASGILVLIEDIGT